MSFTLRQQMLTQNDCYKEAQPMTPKGIVVHSTGANNPYLLRYVQPDDGKLGVNKYNNSWNRSGIEVSTHAMIGRLYDDSVACYQLLPWNIACWGVGRGSKGSYNYNPTGHIQFEICEDALTDKAYFEAVFEQAIALCVYLCKQFGLKADSIVSHKEASALGYGSNHGDPDHWLAKFGKSMDWLRKEVKKRLDAETPATPITTALYRIRKSWSDKDSQVGAYAVLENAKNACPIGYTVYDEQGNAVYTPSDGNAAAEAEIADLKTKLALALAKNDLLTQQVGQFEKAVTAALAALNKLL